MWCAVSGMKDESVIEADWDHVLLMLPEDLESTCAEKSALVRRREVCSAQDLLRICLGYGLCDMSLRRLAAWSCMQGLGELSDVAVLKRLRAASDWLGHLVMQMLHKRGLTGQVGKWRVRLVDATTIQRPGSKGTDLRLHVGFDLGRQSLATVELTDAKGGESFKRHQFAPDEIAVADRGYARAPGIAAALRQGAHVLVRGHWLSLALKNAKGTKRLDTIELMGLVAAGEVADWPVSIEDQGERFALRMIVMRKSESAADKERAEIRAEARKKGRSPDPRALFAAGFIMVVTDLDAQALPAVQALELYRFRWQIELEFKQLKSLHHLSSIRAKDERLARTYIFAKLLGALLVEELTEAGPAFFPWGFPLLREAC